MSIETVKTDLATAPAAEPVEVAATRKLGPLGWVCIGWLATIVGSAVLAPILPLPDPDRSVGAIARRGPGAEGHILGGDSIGRDMLARVVFGARTSLVIAVGAVLLGLLVGGFLGLMAGYIRGKIDTVLTTMFNVLLSIPALVLALSLVAVLASPDPTGQDTISHGRRVMVLILALGIVTVPILGRITRASTLSWAEREFVKASEVSGARPARIIFREVLPNVLPAMMSIALLGIAVAIVAEGSLALLGVGVQEEPTWGNMIAAGRRDLEDAPHIVFIPSMAIFFTVLALNYLGDVVRARFDVREAVL